jgi:hypothetical protein
MYNNEKIYSIELGEDLTLPDPPREQKTVRAAGKARSRPAHSAPQPKPKPDSKPPTTGLHFAPLMILTWILGPFSVHLHPASRNGRAMLAVGMISGMAGLGMFAGRGFILDLIGRGWPLWMWIVIGLAVMVTAFSVWARTAFLACRESRVPRHKLPALLRKPWAVGVVGLVAPGLGLLLAGCARRGAAVIWLGWSVAGAVLLLAHGLQIWNLNRGVDEASIGAVTLEYGLLLAAGILAVGLVVWVAQALEGARQMMGDPGIRLRMRGDWYAAALMCALVTTAIAWDPAALARQMDSGAVILQEQGFRVIPMELTRTAHRLDPAPTEYAVRAIELFEDLGRRDDAVRLRLELEENLASYLALINTENGGAARQAYAGRSPAKEWRVMSERFSEPERDMVPYQAR